MFIKLNCIGDAVINMDQIQAFQKNMQGVLDIKFSYSERIYHYQYADKVKRDDDFEDLCNKLDALTLTENYTQGEIQNVRKS